MTPMAADEEKNKATIISIRGCPPSYPCIFLFLSAAICVICG